MERLKVAIADKILEISSRNPEEMKYRLGKIQRFSDFAEACKTLMAKYPEIEAELLEMVADDDFDASRASRKVDAIISREQKMSEIVTSYTHAAPQIPEEIPIITPPPVETVEVIHREEIVMENEPLGEKIPEEFSEENIIVTPPPVDELDIADEEEIMIEEEAVAGDTPEDFFEEAGVEDELSVTEEVPESEPEILFSTVAEEEWDNEEKKAKRKKQLTLLWQVLAVIVSIAVIILVVQFVINYWKTILIVLGCLLAIALLGLYLRKRNQNKSH